jgi:hypothetical protein
MLACQTNFFCATDFIKCLMTFADGKLILNRVVIPKATRLFFR